MTPSEYALASAVVQSFNEVAMTGFTVDANLTPVVGRIRERPDFTAEHHRKLIEAVFAAEHWWNGPPSLAIIYGNPTIFERSIETARAHYAKPAKTDVNDLRREFLAERED